MHETNKMPSPQEQTSDSNHPSVYNVHRCGIGLLLLKTAQHRVFIKGVALGSAAEASQRISVGDEVIAVDGKSVRIMSEQDIRDAILGRAGSPVALTYIPNHSTAVATLSLMRCFPTTTRSDDSIHESSLPNPRAYWVDRSKEGDEDLSSSPAMCAPPANSSPDTKRKEQNVGRAADHDHLLPLHRSDASDPPAPLRPCTGTRLFGPDAIFQASPASRSQFAAASIDHEPPPPTPQPPLRTVDALPAATACAHRAAGAVRCSDESNLPPGPPHATSGEPPCRAPPPRRAEPLVAAAGREAFHITADVILVAAAGDGGHGGNGVGGGVNGGGGHSGGCVNGGGGHIGGGCVLAGAPVSEDLLDRMLAGRPGQLSTGFGRGGTGGGASAALCPQGVETALFPSAAAAATAVSDASDADAAASASPAAVLSPLARDGDFSAPARGRSTQSTHQELDPLLPAPPSTALAAAGFSVHRTGVSVVEMPDPGLSLGANAPQLHEPGGRRAPGAAGPCGLRLTPPPAAAPQRPGAGRPAAVPRLALTSADAAGTTTVFAPPPSEPAKIAEPFPAEGRPLRRGAAGRQVRGESGLAATDMAATVAPRPALARLNPDKPSSTAHTRPKGVPPLNIAAAAQVCADEAAAAARRTGGVGGGAGWRRGPATGTVGKAAAAAAAKPAARGGLVDREVLPPNPLRPAAVPRLMLPPQ
jgi:hypothetical protein